MRSPRLTLALALIAVLSTTGRAHAAPTVRLDRYAPAPGSEGLFQVEGVPRETPPTVTFVAEHAARPLVFDDGDGDAVSVVSSETVMHIVTDVPATSFLRLAIAVPVVLAAGGPEPIGPRALVGEDVQGGPGLGDATAMARIRGWDDGTFALGGSLTLGVPTATGSYWNGSGAVTGEARVTTELRFHPIAILLNVGARTRPEEEILNVHVGSEVSAGLGVRFAATRWLELGSELLADTGVTSGAAFEGSSSRIETFSRIRVSPWDYGGIDVGAGVGWVNGFGTPEARLLVGVTLPITLELFGYRAGPSEISEKVSTNSGSPGSGARTRARASAADGEAARALAAVDADGDGIPDVTDRCVHMPEDKNGILDGDGCPEGGVQPGGKSDVIEDARGPNR